MRQLVTFLSGSFGGGASAWGLIPFNTVPEAIFSIIFTIIIAIMGGLTAWLIDDILKDRKEKRKENEFRTHTGHF